MMEIRVPLIKSKGKMFDPHDQKRTCPLKDMAKSDRLKHCVYRYRTFMGIEGDDNLDRNVVTEYLHKAKRDHTLTIDSFLFNYFKGGSYGK